MWRLPSRALRRPIPLCHASLTKRLAVAAVRDMSSHLHYRSPIELVAGYRSSVEVSGAVGRREGRPEPASELPAPGVEGSPELVERLVETPGAHFLQRGPPVPEASLGHIQAEQRALLAVAMEVPGMWGPALAPVWAVQGVMELWKLLPLWRWAQLPLWPPVAWHLQQRLRLPAAVRASLAQRPHVWSSPVWRK